MGLISWLSEVFDCRSPGEEFDRDLGPFKRMAVCVGCKCPCPVDICPGCGGQKLKKVVARIRNRYTHLSCSKYVAEKAWQEPGGEWIVYSSKTWAYAPSDF